MDRTWRGLSVGGALACTANVSDRVWALVGLGQMEAGCLIADVTDPDDIQAMGLYNAFSGDVLDCGNDELALFEDCELLAANLPETIADQEPAVHVLGSLDGPSG